MERLHTIADLRKFRKQLTEETFRPEVPRIRLCSGTACTATGTNKVVAAIEEESGKRGISVDVVKTGCQGLCQKGPVMKVEPQGIFYQKVKPEHAKSILAYTVQGGQPFRQSLYRRQNWVRFVISQEACCAERIRRKLLALVALARGNLLERQRAELGSFGNRDGLDFGSFREAGNFR